MPINPSTVLLSSINGTNGFRVDGAAASHVTGSSVASAGDINGDGFADIVIGAWTAGSFNTGKSYVVFGKEGGLAATISLAALASTTGFEIAGAAIFDESGRSVASAGDVNGDGFDDVIIGAPAINTNTGASYVVFGKADSFGAGLNLSSLDGTNGFRLDGNFGNDYSGRSVAAAGDVNGDGYSDLIIGASQSDTGTTDAGSSYVVFGKATYTSTPISLSALNGTTGFRIDGIGSADNSGISVASAGDVNGDGLADLIIGANLTDVNGAESGSSYVVFGKASGFSSSMSLSTLTGANGFRMDGGVAGDRAGSSVSSAGDINGDGFDDLIVGAYRSDPNGSGSGSAYVVFGKAAGFNATFNLTDLNGSNGFRLDGLVADNRTGNSVASAGDINGDGYQDMIIGSYRADSNGANSGSSYVVFGKAGGYLPVVNLATLNGTNGFRIDGSAAEDNSGSSVASAGDVNGDGFDDILVGVRYADFNSATNSGSTYVIYGRATGTLDRVGTDAAEGLGGGDWDDTLYGKGGNDRIDAGGGDDYVSGGSDNDKLNGGEGDDIVKGGSGADTLNGGNGGDTLSGGSGDDIYTTDGFDVLTESSGPGTDTVNSSGSLVLSANFENLNLLGSIDINGTGNALANSINGNIGKNVLKGGDGIDIIAGGDGDDSLYGGKGNDELAGNVGADKFYFDTTLSATTNVDKISTISSIDRIVLDNDIFTGLETSFSVDEFHSFATGTTVVGLDASDNIIYLKETGDLYYDRDGSGTTYSAIKFADLAANTTVNFSHFLLVE